MDAEVSFAAARHPNGNAHNRERARPGGPLAGDKEGLAGSPPSQPPKGSFTKVCAAIVRGNPPMAAPASTTLVADRFPQPIARGAC